MLRVCRICLKEKHHCKRLDRPIHHGKQLSVILESVCGVEVNEPTARVCKKCTQALLIADYIKRKFHLTQEFLQKQKEQGEQLHETYSGQDEYICNDLDYTELDINAIIEDYDKEPEALIEVDNIDTETPVEDTKWENEGSNEVYAAKEAIVDENCIKKPNRKVKPSSKQKISDEKLKLKRIVFAANRKTKYHFECDICPYESNIAKYFREHMLEKHGIDDSRIHKCTHCPKAYVEFRSLEYHVLRVHKCATNTLKYSCTECGKTFAKSSHLKRHYYTHRPDQRPFSCDICEMLFANKPSLQNHVINYHTNIRPHICDRCGKAFGVISSLRVHMKRVHR